VVRVVKELAVLPTITTHLVARCPAQQRLVGATHAVAFYTDAPPPASAAQQVRVKQVVHGGTVRVSAKSVGVIPDHTVVQVDLVCAVAA
jgi:hypothetical protein